MKKAIILVIIISFIFSMSVTIFAANHSVSGTWQTSGGLGVASGTYEVTFWDNYFPGDGVGAGLAYTTENGTYLDNLDIYTRIFWIGGNHPDERHYTSHIHSEGFISLAPNNRTNCTSANGWFNIDDPAYGTWNGGAIGVKPL